jgi:hypothetical protein
MKLFLHACVWNSIKIMMMMNGLQCKLGDKLDENRHNRGWFKINCIVNVQTNYLLGEKYIH